MGVPCSCYFSICKIKAKYFAKVTICLGCVVLWARKKQSGSEIVPFLRETDSAAAFVQAV